MEKAVTNFTMELEEMFEMDMTAVRHHRLNGCKACHLGPHLVPKLTLLDMRKHFEIEGAAAKVSQLDHIIARRSSIIFS